MPSTLSERHQDPVESSTFRGRFSALPCSINQMFLESRSHSHNDAIEDDESRTRYPVIVCLPSARHTRAHTTASPRNGYFLWMCACPPPYRGRAHTQSPGTQKKVVGSLDVISNQVVHSESVRKNGRCQTNRSVQLEAPSEASS